MRYRYDVRITRTNPAGPPVWNDDTNDWEPGTGPIELYNDKALVQDVGEVHPRTAEGMPSLRSDATVFLRDKSKIYDIEPKDTVEVTYPNGRQADAQVLFARELDAAVLVLYL